jgi:hypothetical protein
MEVEDAFSLTWFFVTKHLKMFLLKENHKEEYKVQVVLDPPKEMK